VANDLSAFNAQKWSKKLVQKLNQTNVMLGLINRDWEGDLQNMGDTVKVRTFGSVTMGTWTKNGTISYQDLAPTVESFTVSDASYFAFKVDDVDAAQNDISALDGYTARAMVAINNAVEAKILSKYSSVATANKITGASNAAITLDSGTTAATSVYSNIAKLGEVLSAANVPEEGRWLKIHPAIRTLLYNDTAHFIRASDMGDSIVRSGKLGSTASNTPGFIGQVLNFDVYCSSVKITDGSANYILAGNRDSITYAGVIRKLEALRLQTTFGDAVRGLLLHDATVFAENANTLAYVKCTN
jgi:hypothetical protein